MCSTGHSSASLRPPEEILGMCDATCVLERGSGYPCPYTPTYPVWFWPNGTFNWVAPYRNGSTTEIGNGKILSKVKETRQGDGQWEAQWYGGNHLLEPASLHHVTHCACYYAKGLGMGKSWYLSNYGIAAIPNSAQYPIATVCGQYWLSTTCPQTNASAFERWGPPWIESYLGCSRVPNKANRTVV